MGEEGQLEDKEIDGNLNNKTIIKIHPPLAARYESF
jgi:hypothetical protein